MKRQLWSFLISCIAALLSIISVIRRKPRKATVWGVVAVSAWLATRIWNRQHPIPFPYFLRWMLLLPRGPHSPRHLIDILIPRSGERMLEVGPGIGIHAISVAAALQPEGTLDVLDIQPQMLDAVIRRAGTSGITNIAATLGDAQALPYSNNTFDAIYMIGTLGEIPNQAGALRELWRVLKPDGRVVIGEVLLDPDYVPLSALRRIASNADLVLERTTGTMMAYFALFHPASL